MPLVLVRRSLYLLFGCASRVIGGGIGSRMGLWGAEFYTVLFGGKVSEGAIVADYPEWGGLNMIV